MVFLRATRYYFLLTNHSIHTIKGTEQNLINGLFENLETLDVIGVSDFFDLLPLNSSRRLARNIVTDSVDILDLVYNSYACLFKHVIRDSCKVGGHKVAGCNAS